MPREVFIENERDRMVKRFDWRAIALRERERVVVADLLCPGGCPSPSGITEAYG